MKLKGISVFEQHVDKIVIGVAALICIGIATFQFLGRNEVSLDNKSVTPSELDRILKERAEAIGSKLREGAEAGREIDVSKIPDVAGEFSASLAQPVSPVAVLPSIQSRSGVIAQVTADATAEAMYYVPRLAPPTMLSPVMQTADAISDEAISAHPTLAELFPDAAAPKDLNWLTPYASIPLAQWRAELHKGDAAANPPQQPIPTPWFNDMIYMPDIVFEREELQPDGSWGQLTVIPVLPGNFTYRTLIAGPVDAAMKQSVIDTLGDRTRQIMILQPPFLPTKNEAFTPPTVRREVSAQEAAQQSERDRAKRRIENRAAEIAAEEKRLEAMGGPLEDPKDKDEDEEDDKKKERREEREAPRHDGGGAKFGGQIGGPQDKADPKEQKKDDDKAASDKVRIQLTKKIKRLKENYERMVEQFTAAGGVLDAPKSAPGADVNIDKDEQVMVWAHDISAKPGKTYRYRCVARLFNPFFSKARQLVPEQQKLAEQFVLDSPASDFSEPVEVTPPVRFFVTKASVKPSVGANDLGVGSASIEVFRLYDGVRRTALFTVEPGDRIGRVVEGKTVRGVEQPTVDYTTDWFVVAIVEDLNDQGTTPTGEKNAVVVVKQLGTGRVLELRNPVQDRASTERERLKDEAEAAGSA